MKNFGKLCIATVVAGMAGGVMAQEQIIKIGHIGPTSGPQAHFGRTMKTACAWPSRT